MSVPLNTRFYLLKTWFPTFITSCISICSGRSGHPNATSFLYFVFVFDVVQVDFFDRRLPPKSLPPRKSLKKAVSVLVAIILGARNLLGILLHVNCIALGIIFSISKFSWDVLRFRVSLKSYSAFKCINWIYFPPQIHYILLFFFMMFSMFLNSERSWYKISCIFIYKWCIFVIPVKVILVFVIGSPKSSKAISSPGLKSAIQYIKYNMST